MVVLPPQKPSCGQLRPKFYSRVGKTPKNSKRRQNGAKPQNLPRGVVDQTHSIARQLPGTPKHIFVTKNELFSEEGMGHQTSAQSSTLHTQKLCRKIEIFRKFGIFEIQTFKIFSAPAHTAHREEQKFRPQRAALRALGPAGSAPRTKLCQKIEIFQFFGKSRVF